MKFSADAVEHSQITETGNVLEFVAPKEFLLSSRHEDIAKALERVGARQFKIKVTAGKAAGEATPVVTAEQKADEVAQRALENLEVQRFREVFGGEVRTVRDLKRVE